MKCNEVKLDLEAYVQSQLPQIKAEKIRRHLAGCPSCTHHCHDLKEKVAWLISQREQAPAPMPDYLEQALRSRRPTRPVKTRRSWLPLISIAASFALILFSLTLLGGNYPLNSERTAREGAGWGIINLPLRGDNSIPPYTESGDDSFALGPEHSGGKRGAENYDLRVQAIVTLERGQDVPYQLRYEVTIGATEFTTATLIVNKEKLWPYFAELAVHGHFSHQFIRLTLVFPIDDETLPVHESNHLLKNRTMKEFFEAVYLRLQSDTVTLVYQIPADTIFFVNNAK
jgi:hypothetical protein